MRAHAFENHSRAYSCRPGVECRRVSFEVGSRLGHYEVTALIGEGGMGQVYQATDTKLKRQVALKILPEGFRGRTSTPCPRKASRSSGS